MADSLEANFVLDDEVQQQTETAASTSKQPKRNSTKRSRTQADDGSGSESDDGGHAMKLAAGASTAEKKQKRKDRQKARKARLAVVRQEEEDARVNPAAVPPEFQADWLRKELRKCKACLNLSEIELDEIAIPERRLVDSTAWQGCREEKDLAPFIKKHLSSLISEAESSVNSTRTTKGSPALLVITNNALRASHLARELRSLLPAGSQSAGQDRRPSKKQKPSSDGKSDDMKAADSDGSSDNSLHIAKLFSRHFSPAEQTDFLASHNVLAGAGTAQRIALLIERKALKLDNLQAIVLDAGWRDEKMRGLMDEQGGREGVKDIWDAVRSKREDLQVLLF